MTSRSTFFHYKGGQTPLHKMPPVIKLLLLLLLSLGAFYVPLIPAVCLYLFLIFLSLFYFKFSVKEIFSDNKPSVLYGVMLYAVCVVSNLVSHQFPLKPDDRFFKMWIPVLLSLQITSIFFRCTTILQFNQAFHQIEAFITRKDKTPVADILSLTITFIPRIAAFWNRLSFAWKARGGKQNPGKIKHLTAQLFKISMQEGYLKSLARLNRS